MGFPSVARLLFIHCEKLAAIHAHSVINKQFSIDFVENAIKSVDSICIFHKISCVVMRSDCSKTCTCKAPKFMNVKRPGERNAYCGCPENGSERTK